MQSTLTYGVAQKLHLTESHRPTAQSAFKSQLNEMSTVQRNERRGIKLISSVPDTEKSSGKRKGQL